MKKPAIDPRNKKQFMYERQDGVTIIEILRDKWLATFWLYDDGKIESTSIKVK